jgi:hypothetical protein
MDRLEMVEAREYDKLDELTTHQARLLLDHDKKYIALEAKESFVTHEKPSWAVSVLVFLAMICVSIRRAFLRLSCWIDGFDFDELDEIAQGRKR